MLLKTFFLGFEKITFILAFSISVTSFIQFFGVTEYIIYDLINAISFGFIAVQLSLLAIRIGEILNEFQPGGTLWLGLFTIVFGLVDISWWSGVAIIFSLITITISDDFRTEFLSPKINKIIDRQGATFLKSIVVLVSLLIYIATWMNSHIPDSILLSFFSSMKANNTDDPFLNFLSLTIARGILNALIFISLWGMASFGIKKSNFFSQSFITKKRSFELSAVKMINKIVKNTKASQKDTVKN